MMRTALLALFLLGAVPLALAQETPVDPDVPVTSDEAETLPGETSETDETDAEGEAEEEEDEENVRERVWLQRQTASLRGLDKITGRSTDFQVVVGEIYRFGSLELDLKVCFQTPPEDAPESAAFLQITSTKPMESELVQSEDETPMIFSGWMFASSPGLNALEHPVYDVWVIECATPQVTPQDPE